MANIKKKSLLEISSLLLSEGEEFVTHSVDIDGNPTPLYLIADDNGYAYHKVAAWVKEASGDVVIKTACIASRAQLGKVNVTTDGSGSVGLLSIDGMFYTVGENVPEPESIRSASYCHSEVNNVLVSNALNQAGFSGKDVFLSTGLPLKQYFKGDSSINAATIDKVKLSLNPLAKPVGVESGANIAKHEIYAESIAAYFDWVMDDNLNVVNEIKHGILVVDVGGGTTDISFITPSNEIYLPGSDTKRTGVLDVFRNLRQKLAQEFDIDEDHIRDDMLDKAVRHNTFTVYGEELDCTSEVNAAKAHVARRLNNFINELVTSTLDHIIFVGGGAQALREQLLNLDQYPEGYVIIPDEPQFANVRGMLKFMTYVDTE